ncbi:MAG: IS200/IS605 family transposase [Pleurocapsa minor HA4230-MV1]|jgi:putative transposase|nr:IS200/IS605 family transposase [Pleurocapsa minor HA4230-MV1]
MNKDIYRREKSSVSKINLHLVFVVKYRKKLFTKEILDSMKIVMRGVAKKMNFKILEIEGETDHVHLLVEIPPKLAVSQMVNALKGVSSRMLRKDYPQLRKYKSLWSPSYFAISCGGAPIEAIESYIREQSTPEGAGSNPNSER